MAYGLWRVVVGVARRVVATINLQAISVTMRDIEHKYIASSLTKCRWSSGVGFDDGFWSSPTFKKASRTRSVLMSPLRHSCWTSVSLDVPWLRQAMMSLALAATAAAPPGVVLKLRDTRLGVSVDDK